MSLTKKVSCSDISTVCIISKYYQKMVASLGTFIRNSSIMCDSAKESLTAVLQTCQDPNHSNSAHGKC